LAEWNEAEEEDGSEVEYAALADDGGSGGLAEANNSLLTLDPSSKVVIIVVRWSLTGERVRIVVEWEDIERWGDKREEVTGAGAESGAGAENKWFEAEDEKGAGVGWGEGIEWGNEWEVDTGAADWGI
jgi:hypothetical protein